MKTIDDRTYFRDFWDFFFTFVIRRRPLTRHRWVLIGLTGGLTLSSVVGKNFHWGIAAAIVGSVLVLIAAIEVATALAIWRHARIAKVPSDLTWPHDRLG